MLVQVSKHCPTCDGATYLGNRQLVEYIIGDNAMDPMANNTESGARSLAGRLQIFSDTGILANHRF